MIEINDVKFHDIWVRKERAQNHLIATTIFHGFQTKTGREVSQSYHLQIDYIPIFDEKFMIIEISTNKIDPSYVKSIQKLRDLHVK